VAAAYYPPPFKASQISPVSYTSLHQDNSSFVYNTPHINYNGATQRRHNMPYHPTIGDSGGGGGGGGGGL